MTETPIGSDGADFDAMALVRPQINIEKSYALDDSCQMKLFAWGHFEEDEFRQACRYWLLEWDRRSDSCNYAVVQTYWRTVRAESDQIVADFKYVESKKGRGAYAVTILDEWLPLHMTDVREA